MARQVKLILKAATKRFFPDDKTNGARKVLQLLCGKSPDLLSYDSYGSQSASTKALIDLGVMKVEKLVDLAAKDKASRAAAFTLSHGMSLRPAPPNCHRSPRSAVVAPSSALGGSARGRPPPPPEDGTAAEDNEARGERGGGAARHNAPPPPV